MTEHADLRSGQRILVNGANGAVGHYAVQLAAALGAQVVATGSPSSDEHLRRLGASEVVDHTSTSVADAVTEPLDAVLNLAPVEPQELAALTGLVRDGGVLVSTTVWMPAPGDESRGVRGVDMYVRSDADQLAELVRRVDDGELLVEVAEQVPLPGLPAVHARAASNGISGKVVVVPVAGA